MIWTNGRILPEDALLIPASDRTFEHGLGLFETLRTWGGRARLLSRHLERLTRSADELGIPIDPASLPDEQAVSRLLTACRSSISGDPLLRITLSGGTSLEAGSTLWMKARPLPKPTWDGAASVLISRSAHSLSVGSLARHKSLNYLARRLIYDEALADGFDEVLLSSGTSMNEGSRTNLFLVKSGHLITPFGNLLPGIMRALVIERARARPMPVEEDLVGRDDLWRADEVFLTNSVRGIIPVKRLTDRRVPGSQPREWEAPGPVTKGLVASVLAYLQEGGSAP